MLAPEDDGREITALKFSLASDIVELVVLTRDEVFLQTLREAVGAARRLWHVPSSDKVSDLLVAGGVGILVLDVQALDEMANGFITEIKRQFPDLVVVVAGNRGDETALARLISEGTVYRFIHKPMSPGRARLFADAAVKKYEEQHRRTGGSAVAAITLPANRGLLIAVVFGTLCVVLVATFLLRPSGNPPAVNPAAAPPTESPLLTRAAQALAANRLTTPRGENALELYVQALARDPANADARAGIAEVHERLLARVESALLEERLDEASIALEAARQAGVESGRIAFLVSQLAKAREPRKAAVPSRPKDIARPADAHPVAEADPADHFLALAKQRMNEGHLIDPERDNARFYVQEALRADPGSSTARQSEQALAVKLQAAAQSAIDRRDFTRAAGWIEAATGFAAPAAIENLRQSLRSAERQADADASEQLLKSARERLQQGRLVDPANDSAMYYVASLRSRDPINPGLAPVTQELGARLLTEGKHAIALEQYDAARTSLDAAAGIGYSSPDAAAVQRDLDNALARRKLLANVVNASELKLVKSVPPVYPRKAQESATEGWVEIEFTVDESGEVKEAAVVAANPAGVFEQAAVRALSKWRYKPVVHDAKSIAQRARIRIRFTLAP